MKKFLFIAFCTFMLAAGSTLAQQTFSYAQFSVKHRITFGPVASFYRNDPDMTMETKAKLGFNVAYKLELFLGRRTNFLAGLEYLTEGFSFRGYYKAPGNTYLFDGTFPYTHEIRFSEFQLPVGLKLDLNSEKERKITPYVYGHIAPRQIVSSYFVVTNDSTGITAYDGKGGMEFQYQFLTEGFNFVYDLGIGMQRNFRNNGRAFIFEICYRRGYSRLHYPGHKESNDLNIKDSGLSFTIGLRI